VSQVTITTYHNVHFKKSYYLHNVERWTFRNEFQITNYEKFHACKRLLICSQVCTAHEAASLKLSRDVTVTIFLVFGGNSPWNTAPQRKDSHIYSTERIWFRSKYIRRRIRNLENKYMILLTERKCEPLYHSLWCHIAKHIHTSK